MEFLKKIEWYSKTKADDDALIFFDGKLSISVYILNHDKGDKFYTIYYLPSEK